MKAGILAALVISVGGCEIGERETDYGTIGFVKGFLGGAVADEPRAALVGREVLSAGGSAADAVVAMSFALSVTYPSHAALGGGGVCLTHDRETGAVETLSFLPEAPARRVAGALDVAIPGLPRGMFALHAKHGKMRWEQLVTPAENLARFGERVSRALAYDLQSQGLRLGQSPAARAIFGREGGPLLEGEALRQVNLAAVLGGIRARGPGDFYSGTVAQTFVEGANAAGARITINDLRDYRPRWLASIGVPFGNQTVHFALPPAHGGLVAAQMWRFLADQDRFADTPAEARAHLFAEAAMRAQASRAEGIGREGDLISVLPEQMSDQMLAKLATGYSQEKHTSVDQLPFQARPVRNPEGGTSLLAMDRDGNAVVCGLTMNGAFGVGHVAIGTGIMMAALPDRPGLSGASLSPILVTNHNTREFFFAAVGGGGPAATAATVEVAASVLLGEESLNSALSAKRVDHLGVPDITYYEQGFGEPRVHTLTRRGHKVEPAAVLGFVNVLSCPGGLPVNPESCTGQVDPRGFGLAVSAD